VDMLAIIVSKAKEDSKVKGVVPNLIDGGLSVLQYADNTIIFMDHDIEQAKNLKLLLCAFEQLSGLKINFRKSELFYFGDARDHEYQYSQLFGCNIGSYPFQVLIPFRFLSLSLFGDTHAF